MKQEVGLAGGFFKAWHTETVFTCGCDIKARRQMSWSREGKGQAQGTCSKPVVKVGATEGRVWAEVCGQTESEEWDR